MGKNHRHQKDLKADKAKVKLKQSKTKFLPKGQNVTKTAFKIQPIVLLEQLKEKSADDVLSKRKLNIKDLLSRIKHYNEKARCRACEELTDMVKIHTEEIVRQHLSEVCLAVSCLMQDKERIVRKAAVKSIQAILRNIPPDNLAPFFEFFSTNLRCAMTNIDKNIQEDSLLFLDCFIDTNNDIVLKSSEKLLPDFLSLISKLRRDSQPGRTLTLNLGSKMTSVAWRIQVLSRLHALLKVVLAKNGGAAEISQSAENVFDVSQQTVFPIYKKDLARKLSESPENIFDIKYNTSDQGSDKINRHILTLVALLYETWLEVMPEQKGQKSTSESSTLDEDMGALLTCITNTLFLLWQYVKKNENEDINLKIVFMSSDGQKFLTHLLNNFPYCHNGVRAKKSKNNLNMLERKKDLNFIHENLLICFLYLVLNVNHTQRNLKKEMVEINSYLTKLCIQRSSFNDESMECFIELLTECFGVHSQKWHRSGVDLRIMLENSILLYDHGHISDNRKLKLFQILSNMFNNAHLKSNKKFQNWLATLPNLLCQPTVTDITVSALSDLSKKNCAPFHKALVDKLPDIIKNMPRLQIISTSDSLLHSKAVVKTTLASVFYYVRAYSKEDFEAFQDCINEL